ncbi:MAG: cytochrome c oxidase subunit 3 [Planctomycetales bacterium]|nr:cytochrome c oxidase subunit 3 [Planctomycetales bacterium]
MSQNNSTVAMQFDDAQQQHWAAAFGMWIFLGTEVMFFGGLFLAYTVYRFEYPEVFPAASEHLNLWAGGAMTAILLAGSLLVALSDHLMEHFCNQDASRSGHRLLESDDSAQLSLARSTDKEMSEMQQVIWRRLAITAALGVAFLLLEFYEYFSLYRDGLFPGQRFNGSGFEQLYLGGRSVQIFFVLFFCMTGLHGFHMIIGISLVSGLAVAMKRSKQPARLRNPLMCIGLYWHFVDIIWIFLYPLFYLVR